MNIKRIIKGAALVVGCLGLFSAVSTTVSHQSAHAAVSYDISQYQGQVTNQQASQLKNEVNFMILKAENGGVYQDPQFKNNSQVLSNQGIAYGAYDYSVYANAKQAAAEAKALYRRAPQASFYVNDAEENRAGRRFNASTIAWANALHALTNKPIVLYSGLYFMNTHMTKKTRQAYDALWVAAYGAEPNPSYHYDLWQYTSRHYSKALHEYVDASVFPSGNNKSLDFWTNNGVDDQDSTDSNVDQDPENTNDYQDQNPSQNNQPQSYADVINALTRPQY